MFFLVCCLCVLQKDKHLWCKCNLERKQQCLKAFGLRWTANGACHLLRSVIYGFQIPLLIDSSCLWNQFACSKNKCIAKQWLCDGEDDCGDGVDESVGLCGMYITTVTISHNWGRRKGLKSVCGGTLSTWLTNIK